MEVQEGILIGIREIIVDTQQFDDIALFMAKRTGLLPEPLDKSSMLG
jgi:hypothetical protein